MREKKNALKMKKQTLELSQDQIIAALSLMQERGFDRSTLMKMTLEAMMRAERDIHNEEECDLGNGYRPRRAFAHGKTLELQVPRTRYGNFKPLLLSVLKDQDEEMHRLCHSLYTKGLTTEQVGDVFEELYGHNYSKQSISRMASATKDELMGWLDRPLDAVYPMLFIDCTFVPVRRDKSVAKEAFYTVLGVRADATREVLTIVNTPTESASGWEDVLQGLKARGVAKVHLIVSDGLTGMEHATARQFPGCKHQLCVTHLKRNLLNRVRSNRKEALAQDLKEVFQIENPAHTPEAALQAWKRFCLKWGKQYPAILRMGEDPRYALYFTVFDLPPSVRRMTWTTNWVERLNRDYKRVLKMRGALPNENAVIALMANVALTKRRYDHPVHNLKSAPQFPWVGTLK